MSYRLERRYDVAPLDAALPADAIRAGGGKRASRAGARGVTCLSAVPFFTEAGDVYVFAYKIKKSTLALNGTLSALTSSGHSSLSIAAFSSISKL